MRCCWIISTSQGHIVGKLRNDHYLRFRYLNISVGLAQNIEFIDYFKTLDTFTMEDIHSKANILIHLHSFHLSSTTVECMRPPPHAPQSAHVRIPKAKQRLGKKVFYFKLLKSLQSLCIPFW